MAAVPQRHDEQARLAILAGAFVERRITSAEVGDFTAQVSSFQ